MSQYPPDQPQAPRPPDAPAAARPAAGPTQPRQLPRYKVVLLHDAINDLMFIVRTVMELTRLCRAEATHKMWEAHHCGRSVLLQTYLERAELYVEQFASRNLQVAIEPA
jgi:ATP-dependent Clp protease adapter protein ClpS